MALTVAGSCAQYSSLVLCEAELLNAGSRTRQLLSRRYPVSLRQRAQLPNILYTFEGECAFAFPTSTSFCPRIRRVCGKKLSIHSKKKLSRCGLVRASAGRWWEMPSEDDSSNEDSSYVVDQDTVTLFTTDGLVRLQSSKMTRLSAQKARERYGSDVLRLQPRFKAEDYMDPNQTLCLGAVFDIGATNGLDRNRKLYMLGFTRSVEMLHDVVEDAVRGQGGQVLLAEKAVTDGLHERLTMMVALPHLWGIPPAMERLNYAVRTGGGIVDKVYRRWEFL